MLNKKRYTVHQALLDQVKMMDNKKRLSIKIDVFNVNDGYVTQRNVILRFPMICQSL